ncbi:MAG TPA: GNAT family N-acetyltransferase [Steroidobacteraceae bacterium]|nr:GNAT family N-acetyltransferase [Steroidobacteraceae bacterium]
MTRLSEDLFSNPVWHALHGPHRHLALAQGAACRYRADVCPFAAIAAPADGAFDALRSLLAPAESVWIVDYGRSVAGLSVLDALDCVQMMLPAGVELPAPSAEVEPLGEAHAHEMVALTDVAFPGFFRPNTHRMGYYCGVRANGALIAMGGERLRLAGHPELSGICTHPAHRGQGLASAVIAHLVGRHRREGLRSWLHVGAPNARAIELYTSLGFERTRNLMLHRIARTG